MVILPHSEGREEARPSPKLGLPNGKTFDEFNLKVKLGKMDSWKSGLRLPLVGRDDGCDVEGAVLGMLLF